MFYDLMNNYVLDDVTQIISPLIMSSSYVILRFAFKSIFCKLDPFEKVQHMLLLRSASVPRLLCVKMLAAKI